MPAVKDRQYLALISVFRDAPFEWFDDWPWNVPTATVKALIRKGYVEKHQNGRYRLTPHGRELAARLDTWARSDQRDERRF